eukprot:SAG11_NODE_167_length_13647_cov_7.705049_5_plen_175_part_00
MPAAATRRAATYLVFVRGRLLLLERRIVCGMMGAVLAAEKAEFRHGSECRGDMIWCGRVGEIITMEEYVLKYSDRPDAIYRNEGGKLIQEPNVWHDESNIQSDLNGKNVLLMEDVHRFSQKQVSGNPILQFVSLARMTTSVPVTAEIEAVYKEIIAKSDNSIHPASFSKKNNRA